MLDVGQGDCICVEGPEHKTYLIDGGSSDIKNVGKYRIEPFLKYRGIGSIDYVFVSHGDIDHMNGIEEMLKRQQVGIKIRNLVVTGEAYRDEKVRVTRLMKLFGVDTDDVTEEEIISMVNEGHEQGVLQANEAEMIHNIFEFGDKDAKDIMVHRKNIIAIDGTMTFLKCWISRLKITIRDIRYT